MNVTSTVNSCQLDVPKAIGFIKARDISNLISGCLGPETLTWNADEGSLVFTGVGPITHYQDVDELTKLYSKINAQGKPEVQGDFVELTTWDTQDEDVYPRTHTDILLRHPDGQISHLTNKRLGRGFGQEFVLGEKNKKGTAISLGTVDTLHGKDCCAISSRAFGSRTPKEEWQPARARSPTGTSRDESQSPARTTITYVKDGKDSYWPSPS